jgi:PASTA domain
LRLSVLLAFVVLASLAVCGGAQAATVTVGSPLTADFAGTANGGELTYRNAVLNEPGANVASPHDGTVVRWRMVGSYSGGPFQLVVLRSAGDEKYEAVSASAPEMPDGSESQTFSTSLPIRAGDTIGLNAAPGSFTGDAYAPGSEFNVFVPELLPGGPPQKRTGISTDAELGFNADVEYATPPVIGPPAPPPPVVHCVVPSLTGKKLKAVRKALTRANCKLGKVTKKDGATGKTGKVRRQGAKAGKSLTAGSTVAVTLKP